MMDFLINNCEVRDDGCWNKSSSKQIKACMPMHTFGFPCEIDKIVKICKKYKIEIIEDAAESLGSFYNNKHTGTFGGLGVLSYNGNKIFLLPQMLESQSDLLPWMFQELQLQELGFHLL